MLGKSSTMNYIASSPFKSNNDWGGGGSVIVFLIYSELGHGD